MILDVYIPAIGQQELLVKCLDHLYENLGDGVLSGRMVVIDNGSKEPLTVGNEVIRNEENLGMVGSLKQALDHSEAEVLVYMHSDLFLYEPGWDTQILQAFEDDPKLACLGVVGAVQADANGGRTGTVCAFRDGHLHGSKPTQKITPVAILDGCLMAFRRQTMLDMNLPDTTWPTHHFYDKALALELTMASHHVGVIDLDCEHLGGQTSCRPEYQKWAEEKHGGDHKIYLQAESRYINKWAPCFPVRVESDYTVHVGRRR